MAQTGDVEHGKMGGNLSHAGRGGSSYPNLPAEFSDVSYDRGVVGMAHAQSPNSANSQFFIMFEPGISKRSIHSDWSGHQGHGRCGCDQTGQGA